MDRSLEHHAAIHCINGFFLRLPISDTSHSLFGSLCKQKQPRVTFPFIVWGKKTERHGTIWNSNTAVLSTWHHKTSKPTHANKSVYCNWGITDSFMLGSAFFFFGGGGGLAVDLKQITPRTACRPVRRLLYKPNIALLLMTDKHDDIRCQGSPDSAASWCADLRLMTRLRVGRSGVRIPVQPIYISPLQSIQTGFGAHPASYSMVAGVLSRWYEGRHVMLNTHFHLAQTLRMSGVILLLPPYIFMAWTGAHPALFER
jgi:hypothetical protein